MNVFGKKKSTDGISPLARLEKSRKLKIPKVGRGKKMAILIVVFVLLASLASTALFRLYLVQTTCVNDSKLIQSYNNTVHKEGVTKLSQLNQKIQKKGKYQSDATCVYMSMVAEYGAQNSDKAQTMYQKLKTLESQGQKVSAKVNDGIDRKALEKILQRQQEEKGRRNNGQG